MFCTFCPARHWLAGETGFVLHNRLGRTGAGRSVPQSAIRNRRIGFVCTTGTRPGGLQGAFHRSPVLNPQSASRNPQSRHWLPSALQSQIVNHKSQIRGPASTEGIPLSRGGVARIVPKFCARVTPGKRVTPYARWNKECLARGAFSLFNCCTNGANWELLSHHGDRQKGRRRFTGRRRNVASCSIHWSTLGSRKTSRNSGRRQGASEEDRGGQVLCSCSREHVDAINGV